MSDRSRTFNQSDSNNLPYGSRNVRNNGRGTNGNNNQNQSRVGNQNQDSTIVVSSQTRKTESDSQAVPHYSQGQSR